MIVSPFLIVTVLGILLLATFRPNRMESLLDTAESAFREMFGDASRGVEDSRGSVHDLFWLVSGLPRTCPGKAVRRATGTVLYATVALLLLSVEAALLYLTWRGMLGQGGPIPVWIPEPSILLAIGSVSAATFWGLVLADCYELTDLHDWPDHRQFRAIAWTCAGVLLLLLLGAALYRDLATVGHDSVIIGVLRRAVFVTAGFGAAITAAVAGVALVNLPRLAASLVLIGPISVSMLGLDWLMSGMQSLICAAIRITVSAVQLVALNPEHEDHARPSAGVSQSNDEPQTPASRPPVRRWSTEKDESEPQVPA